MAGRHSRHACRVDKQAGTTGRQRNLQITTHTVKVKRKFSLLTGIEPVTSFFYVQNCTTEPFKIQLQSLLKVFFEYFNPFPIVHPANGSSAIVR
jgi:hypothetical protein